MKTSYHWLAVAVCLCIGQANAEEAKLPDLPNAISSFGAVTLDGYVYVYGGHAGRTHSYSQDTTLGKLRRLKIEDPAKGWEEVAEGLHLQGLALVAHKGKVIRIGGMEPRNKKDEKSDLVSTATVQSFDPATKKWTDLKAMPASRSSHDAVVVGDTIYVVGGWNMGGNSKQSEWYSNTLSLNLADAKAEWKSIEQPFTRRALSITADESKIYACGGLTKDGGIDHTVNILDTKTGKWTTGPKIPGERMNAFTPAVITIDGKIYLNPADGKLYLLAGEEWKSVGNLKTARWVHRTVAWTNGRILALGGATADGNTATIEVVGGK